MSAIAQSSARERARDATELLRARRAQRPRPTVQQLYITALVIAIYGILAGHEISTAVGPGLEPRSLHTWGPAVAVLALLAALRFGCWQGPVVFSAPDVALLLSAPIAIGDLVRPRLTAAFVVAFGAGALVGAVVLLALAGGPSAAGVARSVGGVLGLAALALFAAAAAWLVQSSRRATRLVLGASLPFALAAGGLLLAARAGPAGRSIATWSGPWGWITAPFTGSSGWPAAVALVVLAALATAAFALWRAGASSAEQFLARAEARAGIITSVTMLDYRAAGLTYRAAMPGRAGRPRRLPRPRRRGLVVLWRDLLALVRSPSRVAWAALVCGAGSWEAFSHPGRVPAAAVAAMALYLAASLLCEPLRVDVDTPDKSRLLLSWPFARVLVAHAVVPTITLSIAATATTVVAVLSGTVGPAVLGLIPTLFVPTIAGVVLCASFATLRGGRIDNSTLLSILGTDPSSPVGAVGAIIWLAPWLLVAIGVYGAVTVIVGHAAARAHGMVGPAAVAVAIAVGVLVALSARARRSDPPADA
jgi:hypothetical protein